MYWAGLRALTVLSGDGWLEAQQALADVHGQDQKRCVPAKTVKSSEEFYSREEELRQDNIEMDRSYVNNVVAKRMGADNVPAEDDGLNEVFQGQNDDVCLLLDKKDVPELAKRIFKLQEGETVLAKFPIREDMVGEYVYPLDGAWCFSKFKTIQEYGWKIHVSAWPSSAEKIVNIVLDCLNGMKVEYKVPSTLSRLRWLNFHSRYKETMSQRGKAVTIYPDNDEQACEIVTRLDKKFKEALRRGDLTPSDFCPLTGEYQIGKTGGIFTRLCFYNEEGEDVRRNPEIRSDVASTHVWTESERNSNIINEKLNKDEIGVYKGLIQKQEVLRRKLDSLLPKRRGIAPRIVPLGGAAEQCRRELRDVECEIWKIESNVKSRVAVDYIKREAQGRKVSIENYEHPFKGFSVSLYGHVLEGPVANWPSTGEDGEGDLAALTKTVVKWG